MTGENVKSFVSQTLDHIFFCTQDAISESFHSLLRLFIFNANVSNSEIVHRHISGGKCVSPGQESGSEEGCKAAPGPL